MNANAKHVLEREAVDMDRRVAMLEDQAAGLRRRLAETEASADEARALAADLRSAIQHSSITVEILGPADRTINVRHA